LERFQEILGLLDDGYEGSSALSIIAGLIQKVRSRNVVPRFPDILEAVSQKLSKVTESDIAFLISIFTVVHTADRDSFVSAFQGIFERGTFSALVVTALFNFSSTAHLKLTHFLPPKVQKMITVAKFPTVVDRRNFHTIALPAFLNFLRAPVKMILKAPPFVPIDLRKDLSKIVANGTGATSLSDHKIERLCFLSFFHPTSETRVLAGDSTRTSRCSSKRICRPRSPRGSFSRLKKAVLTLFPRFRGAFPRIAKNGQ
jgi:hypothetical protein